MTQVLQAEGSGMSRPLGKNALLRFIKAHQQALEERASQSRRPSSLL
jgi:hypothetical protein